MRPVQFLALAILSLPAMANVDRVVYGTDGRVEVFEASPENQRIARSTAVQVANNQVLETQFPGVFSLPQADMSAHGICPDVRFATQPAPGSCSGFLVGPDLLVTAGHCIPSATECGDGVWVFGFHTQPNGTAGTAVDGSEVYECKKVISYRLEGLEGMEDHALIQLDRAVWGREPLPVRTEGQVEVGDALTVIGNPDGMPTKVTLGGKVRSSEESTHFVATLDTFEGNSGAAVISDNTSIVEGFLITGEIDYVYDEEKQCSVVNICDENGCNGEGVYRITNILELRERNRVMVAAAMGDLLSVGQYADAGGWVDLYDNSFNSILIHAVLGKQHSVMELLIARGVDVNAQNATGSTALHVAVSLSDATAVRLLLAAGANSKLEDQTGKTAQELISPWNLKQRRIARMLRNAAN